MPGGRISKPLEDIRILDPERFELVQPTYLQPR